MYTRNAVDPNTEPCGTPLPTLPHSDTLPFTANRPEITAQSHL